MPLALCPVAAWYAHASRFAWTFEIWGDRGLSKWSSWASLTSSSYWVPLGERLAFEIIGVPFLLLAVVGYATSGRTPALRLTAVWALAVVIFTVATLPAQRRHIYYQLPLVPPRSVAAGSGIVVLWARGKGGRGALAGLLAASLLLAWRVLVGGFGSTATPYFEERAHMKAATVLLREHVTASYFVSTDRDPALFYNSGKRGFFLPGRDAQLGDAMRCLRESKTQHLLVDEVTLQRWSSSADTQTLGKVLERVASAKAHVLYRLRRP
jgi:hypothetical protein